MHRHTWLWPHMCACTHTHSHTCTHMCPPNPQKACFRVTAASLHALRPFSWLACRQLQLTPNFPDAQIAKFTLYSLTDFFILQVASGPNSQGCEGTRVLLVKRTEHRFYWQCMSPKKTACLGPLGLAHHQDLPPSMNRKESTRPSSGGTLRSIIYYYVFGHCTIEQRLVVHPPETL